MRYKFDEIEIRSENAAKPIGQHRRDVLRWIDAHDKVDNALDYGCGKLRYAGALAANCHRLTLVDSPEQLNRSQVIGGDYTTIREYVPSMWPHSQVLTVDEFKNDRTQHQLALCANVLSVIPDKQVRSEALRLIARSLTSDGHCLFVTQYRDSYFTEAMSSPDAIKHLDGWIKRSRRGASYYGILNKPTLETLVKNHGFTVEESWVHDKAAFVLAKSGNN